jgi:phospholipid/cholesterol/gamma-HCH transport system substrate-binding protein
MSRFLKIGLFVVITGSLSVFYIMQTVDAIDTEDTILIHAYLEDASGLNPDSRVRLAGVNVGRVHSITLEEGKAKVTMELISDTPVYQDSKIIKQMDSLLGNSVISIEPGSMHAGTLPPGGVIRQVESDTVMNRAFSTTERVAAEMEALLQEFRLFLNEGGYAGFEEVLTSARDTVTLTGDLVEQNMLILRSAMYDIAEVAERINLYSDRESQNLSSILEHTASLTRRLDIIAAENDRELSQAIEEIRRSAEAMTAVLESSRAVAEKIERGEGNLGKLVNDEELYQRVMRVSEDVESFVDSSIGMDIELGFQANYLMQSGGVENRAEVRLIPGGKDKEYRFAVTVPPGTGSSGGEDLLVSAQLARQYGAFTLHGGLIESSGGFGLEFQPLKQFAISGQSYRLGRSTGPSLDAAGTLYPVFDPGSNNPFRWLYVSAGMRDILVETERDYYLSLGLRLLDNDLKGIIQFVPTP